MAGLRCFQRDTSEESVPGCSSGGAGDIPTHDYCYIPVESPLSDMPTVSPTMEPTLNPTYGESPLVDFGGEGCTTDSPCGECEGDCDSDADCMAGLRCFQRDTSEESVPGCASGGAGDISTHDYCYIPVELPPTSNPTVDPTISPTMEPTMNPTNEESPLFDFGGEGCTTDSPCGEC